MSLFFDFNYNNDKNEYITCDIKGGLGNQLFQIITTYVYSKKYNKKMVFKNVKNLHNNYNLPRITHWNTLFSNKLNILSEEDYNSLNFKNIYETTPFTHKDIKLDNENYCLNGYYQSFKYFDIDKNTLDFIRHLVYSSDEIMYKSYDQYNYIKKYFNNCQDDDIVSMHFRRTDYILTPNNYHNSLTTQYYSNALNIVNKKNVVIFSDDIEWCENNLNIDNINVYYVKNNDTCLEFILMSMIKHNIIANSTFSLLASYISNYDNKIIVAPKIWLDSNTFPEIYHNKITHVI